MKILILGGGIQGRAIAENLARRSWVHQLTVADLRPPHWTGLPKLATIHLDASHSRSLRSCVAKFDLVVGALPARLGYRAVRATVEAGRPVVDISYMAEDPSPLGQLARRRRVPVIVDAGLAPGLSHLLAGRLNAELDGADSIQILVGGLPRRPAPPLYHAVLYHAEDLLSMYTRPARVRRDRRMHLLDPLQEVRSVTFSGVGRLEAFLSDGLRSLLASLPDVPLVEEWTLRWPRHLDAVRRARGRGKLNAQLFRDSSQNRSGDWVLLRVEAASRHRSFGYELRLKGTAERSAMARATGFTAAAVVSLIAHKGLRKPGLWTMEQLGTDPGIFRAVLSDLRARRIMVRRVSVL